MVTTEEKIGAELGRRVVVVDDDPCFRAVARAIAGRVHGVEICGEVGDAEAGLELIERILPDVLIVDWLMPGKSGLELIRLVRSQRSGESLRILVCTSFPNTRLMEELFGLRVNGFVGKDESFATLEAAISRVLAGGLYFASTAGPASQGERNNREGEQTWVVASGVLPERLAVLPPEVLSPREREVARLVSAGFLSKEIAVQLGIGLRTVESHRANLMSKLGVADVPTLTRWCLRVGLAEA